MRGSPALAASIFPQGGGAQLAMRREGGEGMRGREKLGVGSEALGWEGMSTTGLTGLPPASHTVSDADFR